MRLDMTKTLMYTEAKSSPEKVKNQLSLNNDIVKNIVKIMKEKKISRVITVARGSSDCAANYAKYLFETQLGFSVSSLSPSITTIYGKNIGDDFREQKLTLPVIKAISVATQSEQVFWKKCIGKGEQTDSDLKNALTIMSKHNSLELTRQQALSWSKKAKLALTQVPDSNLKKMLLDLADYVIERIN